MKVEKKEEKKTEKRREFLSPPLDFLVDEGEPEKMVCVSVDNLLTKSLS